ncbi:hypothetical protein [Nonomuraea sp. JJY05]|uniref:hypothetical protein n=1 Tax=Nonomuraea sp. JJY05 TaxID=3350255 RepID=UPI00373EC422
MLSLDKEEADAVASVMYQRFQAESARQKRDQWLLLGLSLILSIPLGVFVNRISAG